jgi:sugar diacid utilization regulator
MAYQAGNISDDEAVNPIGLGELTQPDRALLSTLRSLLVLDRLMTDDADEHQILGLAQTAVASLANCWAVGVELADKPANPVISDQILGLGTGGGRIDLVEADWAWAYPMGSGSRNLGFLVVAAESAPSSEEQFLLRTLVQQTGAALVNCRLHLQEKTTARELSVVNDQLRSTVEALQRSMDIHARLTAVAVSGEGREGIAKAVHELTKLPVAIEDQYGNLHAWAGPDRPERYPKDSPMQREQLLRQAMWDGRPIRAGKRVLAVANSHQVALGVIVLIDPLSQAGDQELMALEHGATVLAMELARIHSIAESELRLRRDLVEELLNGTTVGSAQNRAMALGYDLQRPHRVVVIDGRGRMRSDDLFVHAVRRAAQTEAAGSLLVMRGQEVVLLADSEVDWECLRQSIIKELGGGRARIGVGERCTDVSEFPRSYQQARLALRLPAAAEWDDRAIRFDDLGVYRLLLGIEDLTEVERFVQQWLGDLLAYDELRRADLVRTLSRYLQHGGSYDATAKSLVVHRSTLKYRLKRIREISGHNLSDPEIFFNLQLATRAWSTLSALRSRDTDQSYPQIPGAESPGGRHS